MAQRLILPINDMKFMVGYKVPIYKKEWGFTHYGIDCGSISGGRNVRALGEGVVHSCGMDGPTLKERMGLCIVVVYRDVLLPNGKTVNLSCRMQHFDAIRCQAGQKVKAGDVIGEYGNTGRYTSGPHLHLEFDTDINYPANAFGVSSGGKVIKHGTIDSTIDPSTVWYVGPGQSISTTPDWVKNGHNSAKDITLPRLPAPSTPNPVKPAPSTPAPSTPAPSTPAPIAPQPEDYKALYEQERAKLLECQKKADK